MLGPVRPIAHQRHHHRLLPDEIRDRGLDRGGYAPSLAEVHDAAPEELELGDIPPAAPATSRAINIGGKATLMMGKGDVIVIETPGGGGWGARDGAFEEEGVQTEGDARARWEPRGSVAERGRLQAAFGP